MSIWNRLIGRETRATKIIKSSDPYLAEYFGGGAGAAPSPQLAENLATVLAAVNAISSAIAALPCYVYRSIPDAGRAIDETHPLQQLIRSGPNDHQAWPEFIEWLIASALMRGNALAVAPFDRTGATIAFEPVPWANVAPSVTASGQLVFDITEGLSLGGPQRRRRLLEGECLLLKDRSDDGLLGRSRISRAGPVVRGALNAQEFAGSIYSRGGFPSGAVQIDGKLGNDSKDKLRENIKQMFAGPSNAGAVLILDQGLKWEQISISPEDAELLASRRFTTEELARLFNIPPPMIGDLSHGTFTNSETAGRWFAQHTLRPWITKLQAALARVAFTPAQLQTHSIEFDLSDLLRGDPETRWKSNQIAVDSGILTPNEIREQEGWNPRPDGDGLKAKPAPAPAPEAPQ